ncbi:MAG: cupin domain-containing protein [Thermoleophilia bacterium]
MPDTWFIRNVADTPGWTDGVSGTFVRLEPPDARFADTGINIHVLHPGEPNCRYHHESVQEDFLVLSGECVAIVAGAEHPMRAWDFLHCPAGTDHVLIGAGAGPCAILMIGARRDGATVHYPVNELAERYGASVSTPTDDPREAYADWPSELREVESPWPPR